MVMKAMKVGKAMKKPGDKNKWIIKLMPSKYLPKNKIKHEEIPKHLLPKIKRKSSMTVGDGLAKTKRVKTMPMDNVCKKPAASMTMSESASSGHASVAKRYGLQDTMLTQHEKRLFNNKMDGAKKNVRRA